MKPSSPLAALSVAAMSLPAFSAQPPVETSVSAGFSNYQEADIPRHLLVGGDNRRYDIDIRQFRLLAPIGRSWSVGLDLSQESMSGASPWGTVMRSDGEPALIMSGATIQDSRTEVSVSAAHYGENTSTAFALTRSKEDDYEANALSLSGELTDDRALTTWSVGLSFSNDDVEPTDAAAFGRVRKERRLSRSASLGVSRVIDRSSAVQTGLSVSEHSGYLSDPYKLRDVRPGKRREWAIAARYRRFLNRSNSALHTDYRYYSDDWGIDSHTLHASWYQNFGNSIRIVPNARYYTQSAAVFYRSVDEFGLPLDVNQSSDFRLSAYGAVTLGLKGIFQQPSWSVTISADRYIGREKYGLFSGAEHPARLEFTLVSVVFDFKF